MAVNPTKLKPPDLSPTPEDTATIDGETTTTTTTTMMTRGGLPNNRSGLNLHLQERLLSCGNYGALLDDEERMGRRPSIGSLSLDGGGSSSVSARDRESDDGSYFNIKRSPSQRSLLSLRRGSIPSQTRMYVLGVVGDQGGPNPCLVESFNTFLRRGKLPQHKFVELDSEDVVKSRRVVWPSNQPAPDAILLCTDVSSASSSTRDTIAPLIDAFKTLSCPLFVLLIRSPASTPVQATPQTPGGSIDALNDPLLSRAFSQKTKVRFLRVTLVTDDIQKTLKDILTILDQEIPQISSTRSRGLSSPAPYSRNNSSATNITITPNLDRRGSEASARQLQGLSTQPPSTAPPPPPPQQQQHLFRKTRPFQLVLGRERTGGSSPPQSPKTIKPPPPPFLDPNLSDPVSHDYLSSRVPFTIPSLAQLSTSKFVDPPSPAGTPPSGSRRQSRLLDSESDIASSDVVGEPEELMDWPTDDHDEFARALANLSFSENSGQTWKELIDRLLNPGIPGEDEDFKTIFLVFYRRFAAPSRLLQSLIAKFEEATRSAIDIMLQMIRQTRCCEILKTWLLIAPNDFCYPTTHSQARNFIISLNQQPFLVRHFYELLPIIDNISPNPDNDLDRYWGRTDDNPDQPHEEEDFDHLSKPGGGSQSVPVSPASGTPSRKRSLARWDMSRKHSIKEEHEAPGRLQHTRDAGLLRGDSISMQVSEPGSPEFSRTGSQSTMATTVDGKEIAQRLELVRSHSDVPYGWVDLDGARRYEPYVIPPPGRDRKESSASSAGSTSAVRENKQRMNAFWDAEPVDIAIALTKMEWEYFIALTPRDIPRHMWTPEDKRDKDSPMERIVYYFNHIAKWVALTILSSSKQKDRVRDLEKMLRVVVELRKLDNYDTLFAVISGLENQSVYRLAKTLEEVRKIDLDQVEEGRKRSQGNIRTGTTRAGTLWLKYQSCRALMARDRNFSPYRMAFKNSFSSRIPWISRHKADMLSAAAGNKTFLSPDVIKWSGFQLIGESLLSVLQCRNYPYNIGEGDEKLKRAILETPDISEQELDAKSHEFEPPVKRTYSKSQSTGSQWFGKTFRGR